MYFIDDRYAITTVEVANDCALEYVVCRTIHGAMVRRVMVHPDYHEGGRDFNVAIVVTDQTDEYDRLLFVIYILGLTLSSTGSSGVLL